MQFPSYVACTSLVRGYMRSQWRMLRKMMLPSIMLYLSWDALPLSRQHLAALATILPSFRLSLLYATLFSLTFLFSTPIF